MKKLILFCLLLTFSSQFYAQDASGSAVLKEKKEKLAADKKKADQMAKEKTATAADKKKKIS